MLKGLRMNWKITILSLGIVLFSLCIGGIILTGHIVQVQEDELGRRLLVTARTVAELPAVSQGLNDPAKRDGIQDVVERIRIIHDVDYIVVMDMDGIRLSHPVREYIGTPSKGTDERAAFAEHTYVSKAKGEEGTALRAFVPVMNEQHEQIGVVLVGRLLPGLVTLLMNLRGEAYITILLSLLFGVWGSWLLAGHIKKQMFELEPAEIARLLTERTAAFHAMHEGVIAIDNRERITIFNDRAKEMLQVKGEVIGKPIRDVIPDSRLPEILQMNHPVYNQDLQVGPAFIVSTRIPIKSGGQTIGAVAVFQDRTEVTRMAEELTGVKAFVDALRVQNHEYMNKLHTIGGLLQLGDKEKALQYLFEITEKREVLTRRISERIRNDSLAGLILGKISRGQELGIEVKLDRESRLERLPEALDHHDMVVLIGNLLENAFDALQQKEGEKEVFLSIEQDDEFCSIMVEDNGCGMDAETQRRMFERGFSTKGGSGRGIGLYLIRGIADKGGGQIRVESAPGAGTSIMVEFPMSWKEREGENDGAKDFTSAAD